MATLKEIAKIVNMSPSTVSRVLNRDPELNVTDATRAKILKTANELGYKTVGQRYSEEITKDVPRRIGIAQMFETEEIKQDVYYLILKNLVEEECFAKHWNTVMLFRNEEKVFIKNDDIPLDGLIAIGRFSLDEIATFHEYTDNIVFLDSSPDERKYPSIVPNYQLAVSLALKYFDENGYREVAYVGSVYTLGNRKEIAMDPRFYYYKTTMVNRDLFSEDNLIDCNMNANSAYQEVLKYAKKHGKLPRSMFVASDVLVPGLMKALSELQIKVPEEVNIITFNNTSLSEFAHPPLSSIEVFMRDNAVAAMQSMERLWKKEGCVYKVVIPCELVERESVEKHNKL